MTVLMVKQKQSVTKKKKAPNTDAKDIPITDEALAHIKLGENKEYQRYLKEHNRRLKQLQRESSGRNMVEPW